MYPPKTLFFPPFCITFIREQTLARALLLRGLTPPFFKTGSWDLSHRAFQKRVNEFLAASSFSFLFHMCNPFYFRDVQMSVRLQWCRFANNGETRMRDFIFTGNAFPLFIWVWRLLFGSEFWVETVGFPKVNKGSLIAKQWWSLYLLKGKILSWTKLNSFPWVTRKCSF